MWLSPATKLNTTNGLSASSPSQSPSSSPTPTNNNYNNNIPKKSMEEVWKDINLASLQDEDCPSSAFTNSGNRRAFPWMIFQDFLSTPSEKEPSASVTTLDRRPATMLSLNNSSSRYVENNLSVKGPSNHPSHGNSSNSCGSSSLILGSDVLGSFSLFPSNIRKKRHQQDNGDRRHERMIKNRESAARSRARKQAYTQELEVEVAHLLEENARLRRQQQSFLAAPGQLPKKSSLFRTSTAPF